LLLGGGGAVGIQVGEQPDRDVPELARVQPGRLVHQGLFDPFGEVFPAAQGGLFHLGWDGVDRLDHHPGVGGVELPGGQRVGDQREDRRQFLTGESAPRPELPRRPQPGGGLAGATRSSPVSSPAVLAAPSSPAR
jgi:hypothetical protein